MHACRYLGVQALKKPGRPCHQDRNPAQQGRGRGRRGRTRGGLAGFGEGPAPISTPSPSAPMAMAALLTGQLQHQGCERGSNRPAALDLQSGEGSARGWHQHVRGSSREDRRRGATAVATDVGGGREGVERQHLMEGSQKGECQH